ncbi:HpcH/HpaI aldolase/citrate lyase family protein [Budvicia aquatica]|uniref:Citrate lyase beta subunit n=1 Tax=Budvicia aquatica TaxID=82979 RepID=A0A2C6DE33_9GAMM|nr:HpcH/HpaI aldolase/citrate lyase family protein [Budvicia aquatica]PHI29456.1 citrate lyase subunit beta [Budvicia aquatica]VFS47738.1 Citrate lyase beta subunit [Budvicia aquatica]
MITPYDLGATLYMPATRNDLFQVIAQKKYPNLKSLVICLEDAVVEHEIELGIENLNQLLANVADINLKDAPLIFIRPRNIPMAKRLIAELDLHKVTGFVLPKFELTQVEAWGQTLSATHLLAMPTLETADCFDAAKMNVLATTMSSDPYFSNKTIVVRIGGNDLMHVLGIRRNRAKTLYDGPLGYAIKMIVCTFGPHGFYMTAPVCEIIDSPAVLLAELEIDNEHGLVGKTAIHPKQIEHINNAFKVQVTDYLDALKILNSNSAVFQSNGAMCEPATHHMWAKNIVARSQSYGFIDEISHSLYEQHQSEKIL